MTVDIGYEARGAGDPPLVLLHGIGGGAFTFGPQLTGLSDHRRVVAWNMPGYGGAPIAEDYGFADLSDALRRLLDEIGAGTAVLLGHSIGGMVALDVVARFPDRVAGLILSGTTPAFGSRDGTFQEEFLKARLAPLEAGRTMAEIAEAFIPGLFGEAPDPEGAKLAKQAMAGVPEAAYREAIKCLVTFDRRDGLARINAPTLLIAGDLDKNAPLKTMTKMAETIAGARLEVIRGAGHYAPLERPAEFNALVAGFIDEVAPVAAIARTA